MRIAFLCGSLSLALVACGDNHDTTPDGGGGSDGGSDSGNSCSGVTGTCIEIAGGDAAGLVTAANSLSDGTTIILGAGTFHMTNAVTIRNKSIHLLGQGIDTTTLDFSAEPAQTNGIDVIGDDFLVQDLTVKDAANNAMRVEASNGVVFRRIRSTWSQQASTNGSYGIYPVKSQNVLVEDSKAENASDAGLYVGQCQNVIVRGNTVMGNVAGLEIESTEYADVYNNLATNNTGGIVTFDLPGNPIVGHDVKLHDNMIISNNGMNFAPGGTVASIPVGTGTFAMAARRVEITGNTYMDNDTVDIALISGLALEPNAAAWELPTNTIVGDWMDSDLGLMAGDTAGTIVNYRTYNITVSGNTHVGSGTAPDTTDPLMLGLLLAISYGADPVDSVLYDSIGESMFDSTVAASNSNDNHICVGGETASGSSFASMDLAEQSVSSQVPFFRPAAPFVPFDCTDLVGGPVAAVTLP
ncbi:MAG TPA: parallel beta-helix domain-containing protein [Kofleriaceae bacterium]|jgi:parallel beta-helix repeat protein